MTVQLDDFKLKQRDVWDAGDYATLAELIADVGETVVDRAGIEPGVEVLDVACGSGNAARPAARAGANVTALDLVPALLERGRANAEAEGLAIDWVEGDAEQLPFADAAFDRVLSTFGHMFAPRHAQTAAEMLRVCRNGGRIVTATWSPDGVVARVFRTAAEYMPPPPAYASPPVLWGAEEHVRELFAERATGFAFERQTNRLRWESIDGFADFFMDRFGPMVAARELLGERFAEFRERIVDVWREANEATDGSFVLPQQYLVSVVRL